MSVYRKIITPLRLSNGTVLPANSYVAVPGAIQATNAENGSVFTFQPFQWAEKRAIPGQNERKLGYVFSGYVYSPLFVLFSVEQNLVVRQLMQTMQTGLSRIRSRITRLSWSVLRNQRVEGSPDSDLGPV